MNFIKKINTYLLEHYPLIWNTRLVWMLGVGFLSHLLFFSLGYFSVNDFIDIQAKYNLKGFYFDSPVIFFNILLSVIILLIWIIFFLQNNAFKNLYTLKKGTLFAQFCIILFIFFININQYYSFKEGLKLKIKSLYAWEEVDTDIKEFNKTALFLIKNKRDYEIREKVYPDPFPLLHVQVTNDNDIAFYKRIDTSKAYFKVNSEYYQFFKEKENAEANFLGYEHHEPNYKISRASSSSWDFEDRDVKDIVAFKEDINFCLVNFSKGLYSYGQDSLAKNNRYNFYEDILTKGNEADIKNSLQSFLNLANKYQIDHNLNIDEWYSLLDENNYSYGRNLIEESSSEKKYEEYRKPKSRKNYIITQFILNNKPSNRELEKYTYTKKLKVDESIILTNKDDDKLKTSKTYSVYKEVALSNVPYCDLGRLGNHFSNVHDAYFKKENKDSLLIYLIMSFIAGLLLFLFKVTDIKTVLLSIVTGSVLLILVGLLIAFSSFALRYFLGSESELFLSIIVELSILIGSILAFKFRWKKLVTSILFSLALFVIPILLVSIFSFYESFFSYKERKGNVFFSFTEDYGFWILLVIWILGIAIYTRAIRKWKGLPA